MEQNNLIQEVMNDLLEENKKSNALISGLQKALVELKQQKDENTLSEKLKQLENSCQALPQQFKLTQSSLAEIKVYIQGLKEQLLQPLKQQIKHQHHLHKGFVFVGILVVVTMALTYFLVQMNTKLEDYKAYDLKYRMLKLTNSPALLRVLNDNDSLYMLNKEKIEQLVESKEQEKEQQLEILRVADEKEKEAKEWRQKAQEENMNGRKTRKPNRAAK